MLPLFTELALVPHNPQRQSRSPGRTGTGPMWLYPCLPAACRGLRAQGPAHADHHSILLAGAEQAQPLSLSAPRASCLFVPGVRSQDARPVSLTSLTCSLGGGVVPPLGSRAPDAAAKSLHPTLQHRTPLGGRSSSISPPAHSHFLPAPVQCQRQGHYSGNLPARAGRRAGGHRA